MKKLLVLLIALTLCIASPAMADDPIVITTAGEHAIDLDGATIFSAYGSAINIQSSDAKVTILLKNGTTTTLSSGSGNAGINTGGADVVIRCEDADKENHTCTDTCGKLIVTGGMYGAGIGSNGNRDFTGKITFLGGNITANGSSYAAGIGSGYNGEFNGDVIISGGNITANGYDFAAGIGSGNYGTFTGSVILSGGTVNAKGGADSPGIGSGVYGAMSGKVLVNGGSLTSTAGVMVRNTADPAPAIGVGIDSTLEDSAVIEVNPAPGKIAVKAGANADSAAAVEGSPFTAKTSLKEALEEKRYANFEYIAPDVTPTPVPATPTPAPAPSVPETGDGTNFALLIAWAAVSMIGMTVVLRKKNEA